ncbi:MAG: hypothetical protein IJ597_04615 [Synergistaceae bacterium]|nr:hypothetical protein [Synergistaceae bacterium]
MKRKVLTILTIAGVLGVTSAAFADLNIKIDFSKPKFRPIAKTQTQEPPEPRNLPNGQRPPEPPREFRSGDKHPPMSRDIKGRPPEPPKDDKRPPMSGDKRPPRPRSDDRRPFN